MSEMDYQNRTCGECAYLTVKAPIKHGEVTEKEAGLCRLNILHTTFAVMLRNESACPEFLPRE